MLPNGHPWRDKKPTTSDGKLLYLDIAASNGIGAVTAPVAQTFNTSRTFIYKHNDTIEGFSDPPNAQNGNTTYPNLNETGTQNRNSYLVNLMRLTSNKKIYLAQGGESVSGITNTLTGFNSATTMAEITGLCSSAMAKVKAPFKFAIVNVTDGDAKFNATGPQMGAAFDSFSANLRSACGDPNLPIIMVGLGEDTNPATYPSWSTHRDYFKNTYVADNFHFLQTDDLLAATYCESDGIHWNALGHKVIAGRILNFLKDLNIVPDDRIIHVALAGQSQSGSLGGSTESSSTIGMETVVSTLSSLTRNTAITWYKGTDGGSGSDETSNALEYWWHSGNGERGTELQDYFEGSTESPDYIYLDLVATDANSSLTVSEYKDIQLKIFNEFWSVNPDSVIVLRRAARRTAFGNPTGYQMVRQAQRELAAENTQVILGAEVYDLSLHDTVHVADSDIPKEAERLARVIARNKGYTVSGSVVGPAITGGSIESNTISLNVSLDGGTGITPSTGISGFKIFADGVEVTPTSVTSLGTTITIVLPNAPSGEVTVHYGYDAMTELHNDVSGVSVISSNIVRDNSPELLPLQTVSITL